MLWTSFIYFVDLVTATSIDVKWLFSHGHLLLSHVCSQLSAQSTRALLCLSTWSQLNLVKNGDVKTVSEMQDVEGNDEVELEDGWDCITVRVCSDTNESKIRNFGFNST